MKFDIFTTLIQKLELQTDSCTMHSHRSKYFYEMLSSLERILWIENFFTSSKLSVCWSRIKRDRQKIVDDLMKINKSSEKIVRNNKHVNHAPGRCFCLFQFGDSSDHFLVTFLLLFPTIFRVIDILTCGFTAVKWILFEYQLVLG